MSQEEGSAVELEEQEIESYSKDTDKVDRLFYLQYSVLFARTKIHPYMLEFVERIRRYPRVGTDYLYSPLTRKKGLVNQVEFLGPAHAFAAV